MVEATAVIFSAAAFFWLLLWNDAQMNFAISPVLEDNYCMVVVHAPPPAAPCADYTSGEMSRPTLVACLNHADQLTEQLQRPLSVPVRICDNTGKPVYRHDGHTGGGRTGPSRDRHPPTLGHFLTMLSGGLTALDELGAGEREMHLVLSAGQTPTEAQPAALLATQFEAALAQLALPTTVAVTVWLVQPWQQPHTTPKTDAFCRQLQQQVLTQFSWTESERTPHKKKTYHGMLDSDKGNAELFYEGDMLRSLATVETCPLELLLLLQHLPNNKIRMRLAPSTKYVGQVLFGLPPACPTLVETELQLELAMDAASAPDLKASIPLALNSCTVQQCSTPATRAAGSAGSHLPTYRLTQLPTDTTPAHFALLVRNPYPQSLRLVACNRDVTLTEQDWTELDGTPLAKLQQASLGHLHLQHSLLRPTYTFEEAQPTLERLWLLPSDLPNVSGQRTAEVLQQHLLRLRDNLCQTFQQHVQGPQASAALPVPHMARQLSCLRAWGTQ